MNLELKKRGMGTKMYDIILEGDALNFKLTDIDLEALTTKAAELLFDCCYESDTPILQVLSKLDLLDIQDVANWLVEREDNGDE